MRFREKVNIQTPGTLQKWFKSSKDGSTMSYTDIGTFTKNSSNGFMYDVMTPSFKKLVAQGRIINNPMYQVVGTTSIKPGSSEWIYHWEEQTYGDEIWGWDHIPSLSPPLTVSTDLEVLESIWLDASLVDTASAQAWANVDISEAAVLASLGELPETLNWLKNLYYRFYKVTKAFNKKRLVRHLAKGDLTDLWLEYRYAIRPIIFEAESLVKALQLTKENIRQTARGNAVVEESLGSVATRTNGPTIHWGQEYTVETTQRKEVRAGVLFAIDSDIDLLTHALGFNQPIQSLWELVPFSFIIDWFFNIGEIIATWSPKGDLTPLASWTTETITVTEKGTLTDSWDNFSTTIDGWREYNVTPGSGYSETYFRRRTPKADRPVIPSMSINLDTAKILDLIFIGRKLFRSQ